MALRFWVLTVCTLRCSRSAISVMVLPAQNSRTISASRGVSLLFGHHHAVEQHVLMVGE